VNISPEELVAKGFLRGGTVYPDRTPLRCLNPGALREKWEGLFRTEITRDVQGYAVYLMVVDREVKKSGHAGKGKAGFKRRLPSEFSCLRKVIAGGLPYRGDFPWKHRVPVAMLAGTVVELWVKKHEDVQLMQNEEDELNEYYRGEWAKQGWTKDRTRRPEWPR
jgi:hypothetical protein